MGTLDKRSRRDFLLSQVTEVGLDALRDAKE